MIRRHFIQLLTLAGVSSFQGLNAATKSGKVIATYKITGFSCLTCAVGLDVMMERQKGVLWAKSSYQEALTKVCYYPDLVSDQNLRAAIGSMGFTAEKQG